MVVGSVGFGTTAVRPVFVVLRVVIVQFVTGQRAQPSSTLAAQEVLIALREVVVSAQHHEVNQIFTLMCMAIQVGHFGCHLVVERQVAVGRHVEDGVQHVALVRFQFFNTFLGVGQEVEGYAVGHGVVNEDVDGGILATLIDDVRYGGRLVGFNASLHACAGVHLLCSHRIVVAPLSIIGIVTILAQDGIGQHNLLACRNVLCQIGLFYACYLVKHMVTNVHNIDRDELEVEVGVGYILMIVSGNIRTATSVSIWILIPIVHIQIPVVRLGHVIGGHILHVFRLSILIVVIRKIR